MQWKRILEGQEKEKIGVCSQTLAITQAISMKGIGKDSSDMKVRA